MRPRFLLLLLCLATAGPLARAALEPQETTLTCDHMDMWSEGEETKAICTGKVTVTGTNLRILCDRLELTASRLTGGDKASVPTLEKFRYLLATGNVSITQGSRTATCGRAEVLPREEKLILTDQPVVIDRATNFVSAGEKITMLRGQERVEVEKPRLTGPPIRDLGFDRNSTPPATGHEPAPTPKP
ncbi:LptA/OstA family protein [Opitutus terrae]|uniref:OstA family protein n=1 Tax=Opitutus terrae (strain DSM 11246 / JCM 15787 / PB90-1) TaxID=452637 RepID=B1ZNZ1_OPITP|nr:OstA family protein [Opitutus terrae]ACB77480.1 OstA family protein [Opitutus terrae PB90-1]